MIGLLGRKAVIVILALGLLGGAILAYRQFNPSSSAKLPPEIPATVLDAEVRAALEAARQRVTDEPRAEGAWGDLGVLFRAHQLYPEAIACFREAAGLNPTRPRWPYLLGMVYLLDDSDSALACFRSAYRLAVQPDERSAARLQLADVLLERNELDEAKELYEDGLREDPNNAPCQYGLGVIAYQRGNLADAAARLRAVSNSPFVRQKAAALLAPISRQLGRADEAQRFETQATQPPADKPWPNPFDSGVEASQVGGIARNRIVHELQSHGRHREVVNALQELTQASGDGQNELALGVSTGILGDWAAAEKIFRGVVARYPDYATGRCCLGMSFYFQADPAEKPSGQAPDVKLLESALVEFRKAIELKPDLGQAHLYTAYCLKLLKRPRDAARECTLAIQVLPQSSDAHYTLGELLHEQGQSAEAIPHLEDAARLAPANDMRARTLLQQIRARKP